MSTKDSAPTAPKSLDELLTTCRDTAAAAARAHVGLKPLAEHLLAMHDLFASELAARAAAAAPPPPPPAPTSTETVAGVATPKA